MPWHRRKAGGSEAIFFYNRHWIQKSREENFLTAKRAFCREKEVLRGKTFYFRKTKSDCNRLILKVLILETPSALKQNPLQNSETAIVLKQKPLQNSGTAIVLERKPLQISEPAIVLERKPLQNSETAIVLKRKPLQNSEPAFVPKQEPLGISNPAVACGI